MRAIDRKLVRDILHMKGQVIAICAVIACGVATFVMSLSALEALRGTQQTYYDRYRFADIFAGLKRAPNTLASRIAEIPGVAHVQTRVSREVLLDVPGLSEPAVGRLISIPEKPSVDLNALHLRAGRWIEPGRDSEVIASEGFAQAHGFEIGDHVTAIINGRKKRLQIVGLALSPEYVYTIRLGSLVPDDKRFGIFWMGRRALGSAFNMEGAFNDVALGLSPQADEQEVIERLDELIEPYGGFGAHARRDQISNRFLSDEIRQLERMGTIVPSIFLAVAAFLLNVVLSRIIALQRDQIAALKAFGYSNLAVGFHYLKLVLLVVIVGVAAGSGVGSWLGLKITQIYTRFYKFPMLQFALPPKVVVMALGISSLAGIGGTLNVIRRAIRLPPAEAMRPEPPANFRPTILERLGLAHWLSQPARMILRHIERRPLKAFLSSFGMALAVAILMLGRFSADALDHILDVQFGLQQRQHIGVNFVEPTSLSGLHELQHMPGVIYVEPRRMTPVRFRHGHIERRTLILGLTDDPQLNALMDDELHHVALPPEGLVLNFKLAEMLGVKVGDLLTVEVLEGARPVREVPVAALMQEYLGTFAYMNLRALNHLLREGDSLNEVYLTADDKYVDQLYARLKQTPRVSGITIKKVSVRSFRDTIMENMLQMQFFNVMFACIIAFGVVYNTARVALSERGRELASLRVLGLTRGEISFILLGELAVVTLLALPMGVGMGWSLVKVVCGFLDTEMYRIPFIIAPATYGFSVLVVIAAALVSGLIVRRRLDHLDLVAVLKSRE
ncbi:MAG: FtsX-like permease family protein [Planctomycetaceae bacterium]|nr:FtsX-like permease family protein [Planctomycetaceae bacterium]